MPRRRFQTVGIAVATLLAVLSGGMVRSEADAGSAGALEAQISMPDTASGGAGTAVQVPITIAPGDGVLGIDMTIQYDPAVVVATRVTTSGLAASQGFGLAANANTPGTIFISMYATQNALSGSGEIARIYLNVVGAPGTTSALTFAWVYINEGAITAIRDNGLFTVTCAGASDGTPCNDQDACTLNETCQGGTCTPGSTVVCSAIDSCHDVGICNPATGVCTTPPKPDGTACDDGNGCTQTDTCQSGTCTGSNPIVCSPSDACHLAGTCIPATGACTNPQQPDGTACDDGNSCTSSDQCLSGACAGVPVGGPDEVAHLVLLADKASLVWDQVAGEVAGTVYDAARGDVAGLPAGPGGGDEVCVADDLSVATVSDTAIPAAGGGFWYLVRAQSPCGTGTFGYQELRGLPPVERVTTTCP